MNEIKEAKKMKCYRRLINIQPTQVSGLCGAKRFTQVYRVVWGRHVTDGTDQYVDQKSTKTSGFHFCDKNYFFLLVSKLVFAKTRFVPLKSINCWKSAFLQPDIPAKATIVVPRTVKIWKFKMLYFPNGTRFSTWYSKRIPRDKRGCRLLPIHHCNITSWFAIALAEIRTAV